RVRRRAGKRVRACARHAYGARGVRRGSRRVAPAAGGEPGEPGVKTVVWHLVDAMGSGEELWGKERIIIEVIRTQRRTTRVEPRLICFTAGGLARACAALGVPVVQLEPRASRLPYR